MISAEAKRPLLPEPAPALAPVTLGRASLVSVRLLVLLCTVLPLLVYGSVGIWRYQQVRAETELRLSRALRIATEQAQRFFEGSESLLDQVLQAVGNDDTDGLLQRDKLLRSQLRAMQADKPQVLAIAFHDAAGRPIVSSLDAAAAPPRLAGASVSPPIASASGNAADLRFSAPLAAPANGTAVQVSRPRRLADGRTDGVAVVTLLLAPFERIHSDLAADEPGLAVTMLRGDGTILTRWPPLADAPPQLAATSPVMARIRAGVQAGNAHGVSSVDGRERLLSFSRVGIYPLFMGTGMAVAEIRWRWLVDMAWLAAFGLPPLAGLFLAARVALRRTGDALQAAQRLTDETVARKRVEEALVQAQKLEALGRLTGGVAHDFNNALMIISNNLYLLKKRHPDTGGPQLQSIARAVDSATKLTRQLLAFSRRQPLVPESVVLQERLPTVHDLLAPVLGSQVVLTVSVAPDTAPILVDAAEFELALINLAINALDAMPGGGHFGVAARNADSPAPAGGGRAMVVVEASDTGTGIAAENISRVFEPFFTTKPVGQGTGLGLSQIYGLCQRAGGTATIDSTVGVGTTVRLFFPADASAPRAGQTEGAAAPQALRSSVLLVEDNNDVAAAVQATLETLGCTVTHLDRALAAKQWLEGCTQLPALLLTDVVMPGDMDGAALARHVRTTYPAVAVILMTGYAEQLESIATQGFQVLPKPCSADVLADVISRATARVADAP